MQATTNINIITDNTDDEQSTSSSITTSTELYLSNILLDEHEQEILAFRAIVNRHSTIHEQQSTNKTTKTNLNVTNWNLITVPYTHSYCIFLSWTGDTSPLRYWYNISVHVVDATTDSYLLR